jgi:HK97 family phage portal protein
MGLLDWLFPKDEDDEQPIKLETANRFSLLTAYEPAFRNFSGSIYESDLVRSAIEAKARHISKLKVELQGEAQSALRARIKHAPNAWMTWPQFLARASTILDCTNNLFIVPVQNDLFETIGFFPVLPENVKLLELEDGSLWIRYRFRTGVAGVVEFNRCAYLNKHQYQSDFFGSSNSALRRTLDLISINDQAIKEAAHNSATFRFMGQTTNFVDPDSLAKERERFSEKNLKAEAASGLLLFPNTYKDIKQIDSKPYTVDPDEMKEIQTNVFNYFGVNEKVMQGTANSDELDAFFNSSVEPFAIALSEAMSKAIYTERERSFGNHVYVSANRLQYMTQTAKVSMARDLGDRGILTINEIRELFNYAPIEGGDVAYIRGEYKPVETLEEGEAPTEQSGEEQAQEGA